MQGGNGSSLQRRIEAVRRVFCAVHHDHACPHSDSFLLLSRQSQFLQFYYTYVVNSFLFFLAEGNASSLPLSTLLHSAQLRQFAMLSDSFKDYIVPCTALLPKYNVMYRRGDIVAYLPDNWYSPETALLLYQQVGSPARVHGSLSTWTRTATVCSRNRSYTGSVSVTE